MAETSALRLLVTEHRSCAPDALLLIVQETVRDHRAHDTGRRFGPERQRVAARIIEREHLLLHDVRESPIDRLKSEVASTRGRGFPDTISGKDFARRVFETPPERDVAGSTSFMPVTAEWSLSVRSRLFYSLLIILF